MAARMTFMLIKLLPIGRETNYCEEKTCTQVSKAVYFLLRMKMSSYKQIGVKIASLLLGWAKETKLI